MYQGKVVTEQSGNVSLGGEYVDILAHATNTAIALAADDEPTAGLAEIAGRAQAALEYDYITMQPDEATVAMGALERTRKKHLSEINLRRWWDVTSNVRALVSASRIGHVAAEIERALPRER